MTRLLIQLLKPGKLMDFISRLMTAGLILLADSLLILLVAPALGPLMATALLAAESLFGVIIVGSSFSRHGKLARQEVNNSSFPDQQFSHISGLVISLCLVALPGLASFFVGMLIYIPPLRIAFGKLVLQKNRNEFEELYNYLRAEEE